MTVENSKALDKFINGVMAEAGSTYPSTMKLTIGNNELEIPSQASELFAILEVVSNIMNAQ